MMFDWAMLCVGGGARHAQIKSSRSLACKEILASKWAQPSNQERSESYVYININIIYSFT